MKILFSQNSILFLGLCYARMLEPCYGDLFDFAQLVCKLFEKIGISFIQLLNEKNVVYILTEICHQRSKWFRAKSVLLFCEYSAYKVT